MWALLLFTKVTSYWFGETCIVHDEPCLGTSLKSAFEVWGIYRRFQTLVTKICERRLWDNIATFQVSQNMKVAKRRPTLCQARVYIFSSSSKIDCFSFHKQWRIWRSNSEVFEPPHRWIQRILFGPRIHRKFQDAFHNQAHCCCLAHRDGSR